jgi:hypothetical protein
VCESIRCHGRVSVRACICACSVALALPSLVAHECGWGAGVSVRHAGALSCWVNQNMWCNWRMKRSMARVHVSGRMEVRVCVRVHVCVCVFFFFFGGGRHHVASCTANSGGVVQLARSHRHGRWGKPPDDHRVELNTQKNESGCDERKHIGV